MALVFCDSFDHYATANILDKWSSHASATISSTTRRWSTGGSLCVYRFNSGGYITKGLPTALSTIYVGFAYLTDQGAYPDSAIVLLYSGSTLQVDLRMSASGKFYFTRNGTQVGPTGTFTYSTGQWVYLEMKVYIHGSAGEAILRVDGVTDINGTSLNTSNGASVVDNVTFWGTNRSDTRNWIDDLYICDNTAPNNEFLGDVRVEYLAPTANGATTQFTASTGSNYDTVNETTSPSDTDYNSSSTVGHIDLFTMSDLSASGTIKATQAVIRNLKTDAGSRTVAPKFRIGTTNYSGAATAVLASVRYALDPMDVSPATASGWTDTEINGMEFGYEVAS